MFLRQTTAKTMRGIVEGDLEQATLGWIGDLGYTVVHGRGIAPGETVAERGKSGLDGADWCAFKRDGREYTKILPLGVDWVSRSDIFFKIHKGKLEWHNDILASLSFFRHLRNQSRG